MTWRAGGEPDTPDPGPNTLIQVFTVATGYGFVSRCGCGWRSLHETHNAGLASGQGHLLTHARGEAK